MKTRLNKGRHHGTLVAQLGIWNLLQTGEGRYKVAAREPINGKANYAFGVSNGRVDTHLGLDCTKLRNERPELFDSIENHFKDQRIEALSEPADDESDPYGDKAMTLRKALSKEQHWRRGLLNMRRIEYEHVAAKKESVWESGVRMLWAGIFKTKIEDADLWSAMEYITDHGGDVDLASLLRIEQEYYSGKWRPNASAVLESHLDMLVDDNNFQNEEELIHGTISSEHDARYGVTNAESGAGQPSWVSRAVSADLPTDTGQQRGPAQIIRTDTSTAPSEERPTEPDPFADFR